MDKNKIIGIGGVIVVVLIAYFLAVSNIPSARQDLTIGSTPTILAPEISSDIPNKPTNPVISGSVINIKNAIFNPTPLIVKAGTVVTWVNNDAVPHMIVSNSGNLLNSGRLDPGESFSFKFMVSGVYAYHCNIHPTMKGVVIVEN